MVRRVVNAYHVDWFSPYHFYLIALASIPLVFLILTFIYTFRQINHLSSKETANNNLFREAKIHFGFLILGFKREWWWWTYIIWLRKLLMYSLLANILLSTEENYNIINISIINTVNGFNLFFQQQHRPFCYRSLNNFESVNLLILLVLISSLNILNSELESSPEEIGYGYDLLWGSYLSLALYYLYWWVKHCFPERYEYKKERRPLVKALYWIRRFLHIKYS